MRTTALVGIVLLLAPAAAAEREPPPAPYCMDAREIRETWQSADTTLVVRLNDDTRYRIELADRCPAATLDGQPRILSRGGWVCGSNQELLEAGDRHCAVAGLARIDAREFAEHALAAHRLDGANTLEPVVVTGERARRFHGTTSYCLNTRHMRGWHEDREGLVVEMSPRRSGGNRYYRVELSGPCPDLGFMHHLRLESSLGTSVVCGNPGDRALFGDPSPSASPTAHGADGLSLSSTAMAVDRGCAVTRVYPLERD